MPMAEMHMVTMVMHIPKALVQQLVDLITVMQLTEIKVVTAVTLTVLLAVAAASTNKLLINTQSSKQK
jgi:hypothetical protein